MRIGYARVSTLDQNPKLQLESCEAPAGKCRPKAKTQTINTLWQMTNQFSADEEWAEFNAGADYFTRA